MSAEETLGMKSREALIGRATKEIEKIDTDVDNASAQADLAEQINYAMEQNATTGAFAEASATVKNLAESVLGGDYGGAVQKLYVQGGKGLTIVQRRALAKGLGTMSDQDRVDFDKGLMSIKDPKEAVKYYVEVARLNKERADARQAYVNKLISDGQTIDVVKSSLDQLKRDERPISAIARERVFGTQRQAEAPAAAPKITPEQARAELERRRAQK